MPISLTQSSAGIRQHNAQSRLARNASEHVCMRSFPLQVLTGKGYKVSRYGRDRLVKTFLQASIAEVPTEWTYESVFHNLDKIVHYRYLGMKTAFINFRTTIYTPASFGPCAGWPSPGSLSGRPSGRPSFTLFPGCKVCCSIKLPLRALGSDFLDYRVLMHSLQSNPQKI